MLAAAARRLGTSLAALSSSPSPWLASSNPCQVAPVRGYRTYRLRHAYGRAPILSQEEYLKLKDEGQTEVLSFEEFRFARLCENSSLLRNERFEKFARTVMKHGNMALARRLVEDTFYEIKCIQVAKKRRLAAQEALAAKDAQQGQKKPRMSLVNDPDVERAEDVVTDPMEIFLRAVENAEPLVIVMQVKRGGALFQVPSPVTHERRQYYGSKWIIEAVRERPKRRVKKFPEVMARELIDAFYNQGKVIQKRDEMHKLAEANKAFAHYRWS